MLKLVKSGQKRIVPRFNLLRFNEQARKYREVKAQYKKIEEQINEIGDTILAYEKSKMPVFKFVKGGKD